jgi:outer membrane protein W
MQHQDIGFGRWRGRKRSSAGYASLRKAVRGAEWAEELNLTFDVLIFDEVSQSTVAAFMTAAMAEINKKLGLGGDTKQLPPALMADVATVPRCLVSV